MQDPWKSTNKRRTALSRLAELGVAVELESGSLTLWIPDGMSSPVYVEVGYLMAQLGDEDFPAYFEDGLCSVDSHVICGECEYPYQPVRFADSLPGAIKYRVYLKEDLERRKREVERSSGEQ